MKVFVGSWDVRNGGTGIEVFLNQQAAIDAVIDWCNELGLLSDHPSDCEMTEQEARQTLLSGKSLTFDTRECYYGIEEQAVQGQSAQPKADERRMMPLPVEPLLAVSTAHVKPNNLEWLDRGTGCIFYPNEYGGFLYTGGPNAPNLGPAVPTEVRTIAQWAHAQGFVWVKFDPDGHELDSLPVFQH